MAGNEHPQAHVAEGVIAAVLIASLIASFVRSRWTRWVGLVAQGFALLGTLVGLFTITIEVGPCTALDLVYQAAILVILVWGLAVTARARPRIAGG